MCTVNKMGDMYENTTCGTRAYELLGLSFANLYANIRTCTYISRMLIFLGTVSHRCDRNGSPRDRSPQYNICAFSTVMVRISDIIMDKQRNTAT
jgi:hypothetical protein